MTDALEILADQHAHIDGLLARLRTAESERTQLVGELAEYVSAHLAVEQELFYPRMTAALSAAIHDELLSEHREIKRVLANLLWLDADDTRFSATLETLATLLGGHIAWQDGELFESIAEGVPADVLAELGAVVTTGFESMYCTDLAQAA
ncbi:MAG: hemerythrin domain-containing protein [Kofleriaceae bacterium]